MRALLVIVAGVGEPSMPAQPLFASSPETTSVEPSYRASIAIASAVGLGMLIANPIAQDASAEASDALFVAGVATSLLAPLVVHGVQGEADHAIASTLTRGAGFAAGLFAGAYAGGCESVVLCDESYWGALVGLGVASAIDIVIFSTHRESDEKRSIVPTVSATSSGGQVGVAGAF